MAWDSKDTANVIQGIGTMAGAWGSYETEKERNKLAREALAYEKEQDALALAKAGQAQVNLDDAFSETLLGKKKKKNADGTDVVEDTSLTV